MINYVRGEWEYEINVSITLKLLLCPSGMNHIVYMRWLLLVGWSNLMSRVAFGHHHPFTYKHCLPCSPCKGVAFKKPQWRSNFAFIAVAIMLPGRCTFAFIMHSSRQCMIWFWWIEMKPRFSVTGHLSDDDISTCNCIDSVRKRRIHIVQCFG